MSLTRFAVVCAVAGLSGCTTEHVLKAECYMHQWAVIEASDDVDEDDLRALPEADLRWEVEAEACASEDYLLELDADPNTWIHSDPVSPGGVLRLCRGEVLSGEEVYGELTLSNRWASDITLQSAVLNLGDPSDLEVVVDGGMPATIGARETLVLKIVRTSIGEFGPPPTGTLTLTLSHSLLNDVQTPHYNIAQGENCSLN